MPRQHDHRDDRDHHAHGSRTRIREIRDRDGDADARQGGGPQPPARRMGAPRERETHGHGGPDAHRVPVVERIGEATRSVSALLERAGQGRQAACHREAADQDGRSRDRTGSARPVVTAKRAHDEQEQSGEPERPRRFVQRATDAFCPEDAEPRPDGEGDQGRHRATCRTRRHDPGKQTEREGETQHPPDVEERLRPCDIVIRTASEPGDQQTARERQREKISPHGSRHVRVCQREP